MTKFYEVLHGLLMDNATEILRFLQASLNIIKQLDT